MNSAEEQLHQILSVYCMRARELLRLLAESSSTDKALANAFTLQKSAFHNFVALEAKHAAAGFDVNSDPALCAIGRQAGLLCEEVESALGTAIEKTSESLSLIVRSRINHGAYHSGQPTRNRFLKGA